ncbi:MAG: aminotransferase class I/II-fold pyridoxal phosphate-dependent enzyme [Acidobacteria bacterium]|nr:aminotransferase class I/II-fold pyridoxal phosphate-dependent enzyme [Acidobacteriota bacterium]
MTHVALGVPLEGPPALDPNIVANQRFRADASPGKVNLAVGTNVGADGKPWSQAVAYPAALAALVQSVGTACGSYNAPDLPRLAAAKKFVCDMIDLPAPVRARTVVSWATGGGSGALNRATAFIRAQHPRGERGDGERDDGERGEYDAMVVQADSWPGYRSVAYGSALPFEQCPLDFSEIPARGLIVAQTIHNGTGRLVDDAVWRAMGTQFAARDRALIVDFPYAGFDHSDRPYREAMHASASAIHALVDAGTPVIVAFGPTKVFNTFAYRPGGAAIVICRTGDEAAAADARMKRIERGSTGFIDAVTLALVHAMADNPDGLRADHAAILARLAETAHDWRRHAAGSPLERYFTSAFGGLFRIVPVKPGAIDRLAAQHIHAVDASTASNPRIRINTMGLPHGRAAEIAAAVAAEVV